MSIQYPNQLWNRWTGPLLRLAVVGALAGLFPTVAHAQVTGGVAAPDVPSALRVPDNQVLLFRAFAAGAQLYDCRTGDTGTGTWMFRQPQAVLVGDDGQPLGIHGRGPFWASYDGSKVTGSSPISAPSHDPAHDVPWLLLRGTPEEASGLFASVTYIQRLDTRGGAAPAGPCDPEQQASVSVPYIAVYYFYGAP
jgi:hypothetical protein